MSSSVSVRKDEPVLLLPSSVSEALVRIAPYIHRTPLMMCTLLNQWLGHEVVFKAEGVQKIGAFKIRGALNALLVRQEQRRMPQHIVAFSSGNHAQAVALAGKLLGVRTSVIMPRFVSAIKQQAAVSYGAELILTDTRQEAEALALAMEAQGATFLHPSADNDVIAGQGTACLEALEDAVIPDAIFAACGGGGLLSGTWLAANGFAPGIKVFAAEPKMANDAAQSYRLGRITGFAESPMTIADGARTLQLSELTFQYLRKLDGFFEVEEQAIIYWTQWLAQQTEKKRVLVILSGGNVDAQSQRKIWAESYLEQIPTL